MALFFSRDTKVFLKQNDIIWEIPVLDGFSFSQTTNTSEVTLNESRESSASTKSRRSKRTFNDSLAPAEWSFSTYIRPIVGTNGTDGWETGNNTNPNRVHSIEEALWANFVANNKYTKASTGVAGTWADGVTSASSSTVIDFTGSEVSELGSFELFFSMGSNGKVYKLEKCCVNEASIDFDIDGIATINWTGFSSKISDEGTSAPSATTTIDEKIANTDNFIRNRLTSLAITAADSTTFPGATTNGVYNVTLTGGNITFTNNITFLTPETLGKVDKPLGHITGTRNVTGSFTCYLDSTATGDSDDLFKSLIDAGTAVSNEFDLSFSVGGANNPKVVFDFNQCHLEVPTHSIEDVISLEVNFHALTTSMDPATTKASYESLITYSAS